MSQAGIISTGSAPPPPGVADQYVTDSGTAIPALNILNVLGGPGIETYADPNNGNNLYVKLLNGCSGTETTNGLETKDITCINLGPTPGAYSFTTTVAGFDLTSGTAGVGYFIRGLAITDGASATLVANIDNLHGESAALVNATAVIGVSGNNLIITVTGVAGAVIKWIELTWGVFAE